VVVEELGEEEQKEKEKEKVRKRMREEEGKKSRVEAYEWSKQ